MADEQQDATVHIPGPKPNDDLTTALYRLRGEAVAVGGATEWIVRRLTKSYAGGYSHRDVGRCWKELKAELGRRSLRDGLQPEFASVKGALDARNWAAHGGTFIASVGDSNQVFHYSVDTATGATTTDLVDLSVFQDTVAAARAGHAAAQAVGRALDDDEPSVMGSANQMVRLVLLGHL